MKNIFLTGSIHIGKTTALNAYLSSFRGTVGGFSTFRMTHDDKVIGFSMKPLNARGTVMPAYIARQDEKGNWIPMPDTFNDMGVHILKKALEDKVDLIIMDELGFFEEHAYPFQKAVFECLDSHIPVLGVIKTVSSGFLNDLRKRKDIQILEMTKENRDEIPNKILKLLGYDGYVCVE
ncbi:nucleoside-triphosphatase [Lutispora saccharofermentans]|uniref:Nucleoside-triphosphatase n=1 Tax=Lutispora saccharofermentans TaxID=3024236 RepID=A0ABT1NC96_9FIRM|nr:nucleoside-triphosphatase [Lutispora saccharofermentans]MCQ1528860.1 nucleoside-triphosphatase [Lutispora saccharofermentans]